MGRALASLRERKRMSQEQAGAAFGTSGQNWAKYENGRSPTIFRPDVQRRLMRALNLQPSDLNAALARLTGEPLSAGQFGGVEERSAGFEVWQGLEVRHAVQAAWSYGEAVTRGTYPEGPDPRYTTADQWLAEVVDGSAEGLGILRHDYVKLIDAGDIGYYPRSGDVVLVERVREGDEVELTLRQVEVGPGGIHLWLRSGGPTANLPIHFKPMTEAGAPQPRILGLLVASIRRW